MTAGATFVSRWSTARGIQAIKAIKRALQHQGFSLVEIVCQCPTNFGRRAISSGDPIKGLEWIRARSVTERKAINLSEQELSRRFVLGNFVEKSEPVFEGSSVYQHGGE